ncbi:MAG: nuclear transport factor 2 family protein [Solirubrobacteraceae bacterium]|nr:nuclear transport factor 2 family protein [Solirubrobacteraceae bacterium]
MTNEDLVRAYLDALDRHDMAAARALMSDDFSHAPATPTGVPMDADAFVEIHRVVAASFPDMRRHIVSIEAEGSEVRVTAYVTATHDHHVRLPMLGIDELPPTGRAYRTAPHHDTFTLRAGRITGVHSSFPPGAGLRGLLDQLSTTETG